MNNILTLRKVWKGKKVFLTGHNGSKGSWFFIFLNVLEAKVTGYSLKLNIKLNLFDLIKLNKRLETSIIDNVKEYK